MILNDIILIAVELLLCIILYIIAGAAEKYVTNKWRVCYFIPIVIALVFITVSGFEPLMLGVYFGSILMLVGFLKDSKIIRRIVSVISAVAVFTALPLCADNINYRGIDYAADFNKAFDAMKKHYVLAEHKNIDWEALYEEYLPKFEAVSKSNDEVENYIVWAEFCSEFKDGHVAFAPKEYESVTEKAYKRIFGNDYGLSLMALDDGKIVAVNVEEESEAALAGIHNGTVITAWDGKDPVELGDEYVKYASPVFADYENEMFYRAAFGAGSGGESVTVSYLDDEGTARESVLKKIGPYYNRLKSTLEILTSGLNTGHLTWTEVNEDTVVFRIKMMMFDSSSMTSGEHSALKSAIYTAVEEYKAAGFKNIILDLRGNGGGSGLMVKAISQVFAPEGTHLYCYDGLWSDKDAEYLKDDNGRFLKGEERTYSGEGIWGDNPIVILVNSNSISAADHTVKVLGGLDNVTVMGLTKSNGSAQGIGGVTLESGMLQFSSSLMLDENGDIFIDSGSDYKSGNELEVKIPFDEEAVKSLFDYHEDYVLNKALEYLG